MNNNYFRTIADEAMLGIIVVNDTSAKIEYANARAQEILEIALDEDLTQIKIGDFVCPAMEELESFSLDFLYKSGFNQDVWMKTKAQKIFIARMRIQQFESVSGPLTVLMFDDATFEKKLEREIKTKQENLEAVYHEVLAQNEALLALDKAKDKFMALTTHELRTPLSAIVATLDVVDMKMYDSEEQLDQFVDTMVVEARHLMEIVNDILDMAKIQAGKMDFYIQEQDLASLLQGKANQFEQMAASQGITINVIPPKNASLAYFDELRLGQVLANVINNAIKFNVPKGQVNLSLESRGENVCVVIQDTGKGIPKDKFDKVFNEFETVGSVDTHQKGTGLGMPISKRLIEAMGGKINFDSEVGKGTTFYIEIPQTRVLAEHVYRPRPDLMDDLMRTG